MHVASANGWVRTREGSDCPVNWRRSRDAAALGPKRPESGRGASRWPTQPHGQPHACAVQKAATRTNTVCQRSTREGLAVQAAGNGERRAACARNTHCRRSALTALGHPAPLSMCGSGFHDHVAQTVRQASRERHQQGRAAPRGRRTCTQHSTTSASSSYANSFSQSGRSLRWDRGHAQPLNATIARTRGQARTLAGTGTARSA